MKFFRKFIFLLALLPFAATAQPLKFETLSCEAYIQQPTYYRNKDFTCLLHLDGKGDQQGEIRLYERRQTDSTLLFSGRLRDNYLVDTATWYYPDGKRMRVAVFTKDGRTGRYPDNWSDTYFYLGFGGSLEGKARTWHKDGSLLAEEYFRDGKRQGVYKE
jgi:hypothetical protein